MHLFCYGTRVYTNNNYTTTPAPATIPYSTLYQFPILQFDYYVQYVLLTTLWSI
jgi:hypothetical protein